MPSFGTLQRTTCESHAVFSCRNQPIWLYKYTIVCLARLLQVTLHALLSKHDCNFSKTSETVGIHDRDAFEQPPPPAPVSASIPQAIPVLCVDARHAFSLYPRSACLKCRRCKPQSLLICFAIIPLLTQSRRSPMAPAPPQASIPIQDVSPPTGNGPSNVFGQRGHQGTLQDSRARRDLMPAIAPPPVPQARPQETEAADEGRPAKRQKLAQAPPGHGVPAFAAHNYRAHAKTTGSRKKRVAKACQHCR